MRRIVAAVALAVVLGLALAPAALAISARTIAYYKASLTDAGSNNIFDIALATDATSAGVIDWLVYAADANDRQAVWGTATWAAVNKGGTITVVLTSNTVESALSTGTMTVTWAVATGASKITISVTPNSSLVPTTLFVDGELRQRTSQAVTLL